MALAIQRLTQNRFILLTSILGVSGWIISFAGAISLQKLYGAWWVVVYQAFIVILSLLIFMSNTMAQYRLAFLTFIAASIPLLTVQADYVIQYTKPSVPRDPANAYAAGYIILICVQYLWVIVFGSDPNSYFGSFGRIESDGHPHQQIHSTDQQQSVYISTNEKHLDDATIVNDKRIVMPPYPTSTHVITAPPTDNSTICSTSSSSPPTQKQQKQPIQNEYLPPAVEYYEKVEALHAYKANQEDPNELGFEKGEILEVVDRKGNWWQARKNNGQIGIIPSNYFALPASSNSSADSY